MNQPKKKFSFKKLKEKINIKNIISNIKEKRLENKKILQTWIIQYRRNGDRDRHSGGVKSGYPGTALQLQRN